MRIIVAGGSGFVGKVLLRHLLKNGHDVILLTRNCSGADHAANRKITILRWDAKSLHGWEKHISGADAIVNLAGENIGEKRWTKFQKQRITESRIATTRLLVEAAKAAKVKPSVLVNASAVGYYGNVAEGEVVEAHEPAKGFLANLCVNWENEAQKAAGFGLRVVCLRIGVVLGRGGGVLKKTELPFKLFFGGPLGDGQQWFPWIHIHDLAGIILFALERTALAGSINSTAPHPVRMEDFCRLLGKSLHRPSWAPVPGFILKLLLGEMSSLVLSGQKAVPKKLLEAGFIFKYPELGPALRDLYFGSESSEERSGYGLF